MTNGASFIYREANSRYIGVQFSVEGRDLASAVNEAIGLVNQKVTMPPGYRARLGGRIHRIYCLKQSAAPDPAADRLPDLPALVPALQQFQIPLHHRGGVLLSAPIGGIIALFLTGTPFSVSSGVGFLALFGVSVLTGVVYISYVNELRRDGMSTTQAIREGAILRLRPIMMTALVASLGLFPAAIATGVGTNSQKPFAIVIVAGLLTRLAISIYLMPVLYALVARPDDGWKYEKTASRVFSRGRPAILKLRR